MVERHDSERAISPAVAVLERLRPGAGAVGAMGARHALGATGRAGGVEQEGRLLFVAVERARVLRTVGQPVAVADHDARAAVAEAIVELRLREPPGERDEDRAGPLRGPVEERGLEPVVEDDGDAFARVEPEPAGDSPHAGEQLAVGEPGKRLQLGMALAGSEQGLREVHCPAAWRIASTIGS